MNLKRVRLSALVGGRLRSCKMRDMRQLGFPAFVIMLLGGCSDDVGSDLSGTWNVSESFADEVHFISCESTGLLDIIQTSRSNPGQSTPGPTFMGTFENDNACTSLDGPFNYLGDGIVSSGLVITSGKAVIFQATVNEALCEYRGEIQSRAGLASDMSGSLTCVLEDAGVTFNFAGVWTARNEHSEWCEARRDLPGCAAT